MGEMSTATLTEKGQITIPRLIRKMLGMTAHQKILFVPKKESVELVPMKGNLLNLFGVFHAKKAKRVADWQSVRTVVRRRMVAGRLRGS